MRKPRTPLPWIPRTIIHLALAEDVDFAVRACNSYDDLLAALKDAPVPGTFAWMTWYEGERKVAIDKAHA